ncbi:hypothetical protein [Actinoplanes sp. NPDC049118]|uniref:hypothetical protein n=1 Tax=Actinoplanes sp. NPDC049118 TaxID=3155769 RepID=UPI00340A19B4
MIENGTRHLAPPAPPAPRAGSDNTRLDLSALPAVRRRARCLLTRREYSARLRLLAQALSRFDPITAPNDQRLVWTALDYLQAADPCYIDVCVGHRGARDEDFQLSWSLYAYRAADRCCGTRSELWLNAAFAHGEVLTEQGLTVDAVTVQQRLLPVSRQFDRRPERTAHAGRSLAKALHADGRCTDAHHEISTALTRWRLHPNPFIDSGKSLLFDYLSLLAGCGQEEQARAVLDEHGDLFGAPGSINRESAIWVTLMLQRDLDRTHPPICQLRPRPATPVEDDDTAIATRDYWYTLLTDGLPASSRASQ